MEGTTEASASSLPMEELEKYNILKTIGSGTYGKVMLAEHIPTGTHVALKMIPKKTLPSLENGNLEAEALRALRHPNILKLLDVIEDEHFIWLVTEYARGGDLFWHVARRRGLGEEEARPLFRQLLAAVGHCHEHRIVHRDLKSPNVLLDAHGNVKLADFGFAATFSDEEDLYTFCGTPCFCPPEMFLEEDYRGPEVDVWSLGVLLYFMVAGRIPFDGSSWEELKTTITEGRYETPASFSRELTALLRKILTVDPKLRPALSGLMEDVWVQGQGTPKATASARSLRSRWRSPQVSVAPQRSPEASPSTQSSSLGEETSGDGSVRPGKPHEESATSLSEEEDGQGLKGLARRLGKFLLTYCCILPAEKICRRHRKLNKVVPVSQDS
nr:MAP/microtubule affinity-regulating kinase 3-like [Microcebus murinus]XP_012616605.1 MAP/microtubule affinity-regulating kinase 3-like [Microcebus murinus]XP_012616607.1 MAP/microtubule affinity-regulating kinase 3-like [Microcebus murinus]